MKTFGCLAYASNHQLDTDKFKPRVFIVYGYPTTQKGYKLLNLQSKTIFISRDVQFIEHIFPLYQKGLSSYTHPTPIPMHPTSWMDDVSLISSNEHSLVPSPISSALVPTTSSAIPTASTPLRRSSGSASQPIWLADYVTVVVYAENTSPLPYAMANYVEYVHFSPPYQVFISVLD